ncbi:MAG TPA: AraC family transcriptional regulator [Methylophilaceae bacterium]|nr:AraC family transcriptional regulator [Methylophilaceae bacterium]HAJ72691.1 AraC family transcriptional regulator [Methylophilaceae bacterium]
MTKTTLNYAETTDLVINKCVFSDIMKSMRVSGNMLINEEYLPPWSVSIPDASGLERLLKLDKGTQAVAFHYVKRGFIEVVPEVGELIMVEAGEMAICFGGVAHQLSQYPEKKSVSVESILIDGNNPFAPNEKNRVRSTSVMCGVFMLKNVELNPLLAALPKILHVSTKKFDISSNLTNILGWIDREISQTVQCTYVIERLLELLCAEVLRAHLYQLTTSSGWFYAMKDPIISRAISMIHAQPGDEWSVNRLAGGVAMSPSRFAARFNAALGDSPMAYVTKWRMNLAGRMLRESQQKVEEVAISVGYENVAAFSRTFKRHLGVSPAAWRVRLNYV